MTETKPQHKTPTKQGVRKPSVSPLNGVPTPPGFEAHPERRHNGAWKKEETARWKFEQWIKMTTEELNELLKKENLAAFDIAVINVILKVKVMAENAANPADLEKCLSMLERIVVQIYGQPKQVVEETKIELKSILPKLKKDK